MFGRTSRRGIALRLAGLAAAVLVALGSYASTFVVSYGDLFRVRDPLLVTDVARLTPTRVARIVEIHDVPQLRAALADARARHLKVSIAGRRHSQGGQTYVEGGVVLDMRGFHAIRSIDPEAMTVTVESGATWDEVQRAIAPHGLALKVMQSGNIFTVGGSMSANAHGRDLDLAQMVQVVERFRLMLADGSILEVSRNEHPELFSLVIGGYGLYGVILDVTLRVTRDELYTQRSTVVDYAAFPSYFRRRIQPDSDVRLMIARPSIVPGPHTFLRETVVATWRRAKSGTAPPSVFALTEESHVLRDRFFFGLSRRFDWAKSLRWKLQRRLEPTLANARLVSRNNAMRPPVAPVEFLEYHARRDTDILQEYFVPIDHFVDFVDRCRDIVVTGRMNVLSVTVRYVTPDSTPVLAYAPRHEAFAVVLFMNVGLSAPSQAHARAVTRQLVDAALADAGTYYLTYQLYPTSDQLRRAYPRAALGFERKRFYDPDTVFASRFYERYGR